MLKKHLQKFLSLLLICWGVSADAQTYCVTSPTTGGSTDIITKVSVSTVLGSVYTNSTTYSTAAPAYYTSYANTPINLPLGTSNTISITFGSDGVQFSAVWIDYNRDGVFQTSENIGLATASASGNGTKTYTFTVPAGTALGLTTMRVRGGSDNVYTAAGACTASGYGETEDYKVNITGPACLPPTAVTGSNITATSATVSFTAPANTPGNGYDYFYTSTNTPPAANATPAGHATSSPIAVIEPCAAACPANGNLLVNGSFEDAVLPPAIGWAALTQPGWMELAPGNNGLIETWKGSAYNLEAPSGNQFVELNYLTLGTIAQDVNVVPNQPMTLSFYHRARIFYAGHSESLRVDVVDLNTDQVIHTFTSNVMGDWENFTTTFTPTSNKIEVRFVSLNASGNENDQTFGNFLDDVALNYNSCLCGSPITIVGDTTVCLASGEYSTLRVDGCAGGNISWVYNNQGDPYVSQTTYGFTGVSYVASCSQPGCPDTTFSPSVTVSCDAQQRGINNSALSTEPVSLSVAPNPVMDAAKLKLSGFNNGEISIQITNLNGSVISNTKSINVNGIDLPLDMSQLRSGMYFIKAQQGNKIAVSKVIKK